METIHNGNCFCPSADGGKAAGNGPNEDFELRTGERQKTGNSRKNGGPVPEGEEEEENVPQQQGGIGIGTRRTAADGDEDNEEETIRQILQVLTQLQIPPLLSRNCNVAAMAMLTRPSIQFPRIFPVLVRQNN